jgi:hypothetical protein
MRNLGPFRNESGFGLTRAAAAAIIIIGCLSGHTDYMTTLVCVLTLADWRISL